MKRDDILLLLVLVCSLGLGFIIGQKHPQKSPTEPINVKVDTLFIRDTITISEPISVEKRIIEKQLVRVTDTLNIHDTLFVYLDREQVVWQDSLSVVYASGILPQVDSVKHFTSSQIVTIETAYPYKVRSHWGIGVQAGYGASRYGITPYIGLGVSYNLITW